MPAEAALFQNLGLLGLLDSGDCGDNWIFGVNYLARALRQGDATGADMTLALLLGRNYSMQCPDTLPDRAKTFARTNGGAAWPISTKQANFVWGDGAFMNLALGMRLAPGLGLEGRTWIERMVVMHLEGYVPYLRDPLLTR